MRGARCVFSTSCPSHFARSLTLILPAASVRLARGQRTLSSLSRAFLRPSITLYNESPPSSAALTIGTLSLSDLSGASGPDVMLVLGTSLKIPGFKKLVKEFSRSVKSRGGVRVLVNREEIGSKSEWRDVFDYQGASGSPLVVSPRLVGAVLTILVLSQCSATRTGS